MYTTIIISIIISAAVGVIAKFALDKFNLEQEITWKEYGISLAVIMLIIVPGTAKLGWDISKNNLVTYNEYLNGWEEMVIKSKIVCERDGSCRHDYDCDPYTVIVSYSCNCDDKGNCSTCYRNETRYHSCPYVDVEFDYEVQTSLGNVEISNHRFPDNPQSHRWRKNESIPQSVIQSAGVGDPPFWTAVKNRLEKNEPGPVAMRKDYENYIYASDNTILKQYSSDIRKYKLLGLLPKLQNEIYDFYKADKVYFVGFKSSNFRSWTDRLSYLNADLGMKLQGDLHLVIVKSLTVSQNSDAYHLALKAYWQNKAEFEKNTFSKNGIAVIIGTADGKTVSWARAFTGMPLGNEDMIVKIDNQLKGVELTPEAIIGEVSRRTDNGVKTVHGKGILENIVFGLENPSLKFQRISMSGKGKTGKGKGSGFMYLKNEIQPTGNQRKIIILVSFLISSIAWVVAAFIGIRTFRRR